MRKDKARFATTLNRSNVQEARSLELLLWSDWVASATRPRQTCLAPSGGIQGSVETGLALPVFAERSLAVRSGLPELSIRSDKGRLEWIAAVSLPSSWPYRLG